MENITSKTIVVKANKSKRTFTIRVNGSKYRTTTFNRVEFDNANYWTVSDWNQFLKTHEYYKIK